jgi:hypothetical protein
VSGARELDHGAVRELFGGMLGVSGGSGRVVLAGEDQGRDVTADRGVLHRINRPDTPRLTGSVKQFVEGGQQIQVGWIDGQHLGQCLR